MANPTPKAILNQRFGKDACYKVEEVRESNKEECPGLIFLQKGPPLYRCMLKLPTLSVTSETFKKKRDAEQSAAQIALSKLGIIISPVCPTKLEPWEAIIDRMRYLLSNKLIHSEHPLSGHIIAAVRREYGQRGSLSTSVFASFDTQIRNLCKSIMPRVEYDPLDMAKLVRKAAQHLPDLVVTDEKKLCLERLGTCISEIVELSSKWENESSGIEIMQVLVPKSLCKSVESYTLFVSPDEYYLDAIAHKLGQENANNLLLSRTIGNVSSHVRLHYTVTDEKTLFIDSFSSDLEKEKDFKIDEFVNTRASYLSGQRIYGDAIISCIGYVWKSKDIFYEDLGLQSYYRMVIRKEPSGIYRLSRNSCLAATLPKVFTSKTNWKGSSPREVLSSFCRQHRLLDPEFTIMPLSSTAYCKLLSLNNKLKASLEGPALLQDCDNKKRITLAQNYLQCKAKLTSKFDSLVIECCPKVVYTKENESINIVSLRLLSWLTLYFEDFDNPIERLRNSASSLDISFDPEIFCDMFIAHPSGSHVQSINIFNNSFLAVDKADTPFCSGIKSFKVESVESDGIPSPGSVFCIRYAAFLVTAKERQKELLESKDEFEFESGTGAVIPLLEDTITQLSVGKSTCFVTDLPGLELVLSASGDTTKIIPMLAETCYVEYSVTLLSVTEPPEEKMEQAFFNPSLSKQRVEYALQHITKASACTLIDYGCGAGSLLESLVNYPTTLKKIVGVDISEKGLIRAAKVLHSRLNTSKNTSIESMILYKGDVLKPNALLHNFDVGTCLEVIEHMLEEEAWEFGNIVLGNLCPMILLVSTPNYEYNVILQGLDDKNEANSIHYRNSDHKFEWTREQFEHWASQLAEKHNYSVEFSGVGGSAGVEPGFASQIAIFSRNFEIQENSVPETEHESSVQLIWSWNSDD